MSLESLKREWRIWVLVIALCGSLAAIGPHFVTEKSNGKVVIGTNINTGLDLQGGARLLIAPAENATFDQIKIIADRLRRRINMYGLKDIKIRQISTFGEYYLQIELAGASSTELKDFVETQGKFEAYVPIPIENNSVVQLGENKYTVIVNAGNESIWVDGVRHYANESFELSSGARSIKLEYRTTENKTKVLYVLAFTGEDIKKIYRDPGRSRLEMNGDVWVKSFQIQISNDAAERFRDIMQGLSVVGLGVNRYMSSNLELYLDDQLMESLRIGHEFKTKIIKEPSISASAATKEKAIEQSNQLMSILESGALPVEIKVLSTSVISPSLGRHFIRIAVLGMFAAIVGVGIVVFLRYKNPKIVLPIVITGVSEIVILLGLFSTADLNVFTLGAVFIPTALGVLMCYKEDAASVFILPVAALLILVIMVLPPSLDLPAIGGVIAAVGTGVDDQIVITDEGLRRELKSLRERIKRAFFIIFTSAASTIGAMMPLYYIGAGAVAGFATTTIIGVLIGVFVTRPAYAKVIEKI